MSTTTNYSLPFDAEGAQINEIICAALAEYEAMKHHSKNYKCYDSFEELLDETVEDASEDGANLLS